METDYRNKLVLAPMVRVGTLPFRLLAAEYDADITYGEEIIDHRLLKCERRFKDMFAKILGTIEMVEKKTINVFLRTCPEERGRVVLQIGTSYAIRALRAAETVCLDVAASDVYMSYPKSFSISGGMGAALLTKPELIHDASRPSYFDNIEKKPRYICNMQDPFAKIIPRHCGTSKEN